LAQIRPDVDQARSQSRKTGKIASSYVARSPVNWITSMPGFGCCWWRVPMPHKSYGRTSMRAKLLAMTALVASGVIATAFLVQSLSSSSAQTQTRPRYLPEYTASGDLVLPKNFNEWVYVGSPLTPIALNGGKACPEPASASSGPCTGFPEYHNVYIEPGSYEIYKQTKQFPEGTILFKELQLTLPAQNPDGSRTEPSGRGFFGGKFNGADVTVKDTKRFAASGGWGYFNFNHHEPKAPTAKVTDCGHACHLGGAKKDEVWTQFYPLLDK
jgi:Cytochrome P460